MMRAGWQGGGFLEWTTGSVAAKRGQGPGFRLLGWHRVVIDLPADLTAQQDTLAYRNYNLLFQSITVLYPGLYQISSLVSKCTATHNTVMNGKKALIAKQNVFGYGIVEAVLAEVLKVEPEKLKAFRARLLHLRNLGVPRALPKPGSGTRIGYSLIQIHEMLFTVLLENAGFTPRLAVQVGPSIPEKFAWDSEGDAYVVLIRAKAGMSFTYVSGCEELVKTLPDLLKSNEIASLINVSVLVTKMEKALTKVLRG